jgi:thiol:disulfide interchange protein
MRTLQRVLAVPMALTAAACLWLLWRLSGAELTWIAALAAVLFGLALAAFGSQRESRAQWGWGLAALAVFASIAVVRQIAVAAPRALAKLTDPAWSDSEVAALRAQNRPVFVYFTADWCLTCKANEAAAIDRPAVRAAFAANKVAVRAADWTRGDPAITRFLEARGRAGVPLYLWYAPGKSEPEELPQLLTPGMLTTRANDPS